MVTEGLWNARNDLDAILCRIEMAVVLARSFLMTEDDEGAVCILRGMRRLTSPMAEAAARLEAERKAAGPGGAE